MNKLIATLLLLSVAAAPARAQDYRIEHLEPPFWWAGMQHPKLQLMVHGKQIADLDPVLAYPGIKIDTVTRGPNRNYLFIDLAIATDAKPGSFDLVLRKGAKSIKTTYQLMAREPGSAQRAGFGPKDAIYQIMPDRFANGDPSNDTVKGMADKLNRADGSGRHGGDIQGVICLLYTSPSPRD